MLNFSRLKMESLSMTTSSEAAASSATSKAAATSKRNNNDQLHATHNRRERCQQQRLGGHSMLTCTNYGGALLQVFLILTLFVIGNLSAWQENIRPKLYVELGESLN